MKKYLEIFWLTNKMWFQSEIAYRVEVIFLFLNTLVLIAATVILYVLIFSQTTTVGDWDLTSMFYLFAVGNVVVSVYTMFAWGPIYHQFRPAIKTGKLDIFLLKPMSPGFLVLTGRFDLSGFARFVPSLGLLIYLLWTSPVQASATQIITFFIFLLTGMGLLYLLIFLIYVAGFWTTSTDYFHHLAWSFISATSQPTSVFPKLVFGIFSTILPVAFAAVIPVRILVGLEPVTLQAYVGLIVILLFFGLISGFAWNRGLRRYGSVSS